MINTDLLLRVLNKLVTRIDGHSKVLSALARLALEVNGELEDLNSRIEALEKKNN
jgi:hypothetical protein